MNCNTHRYPLPTCAIHGEDSSVRVTARAFVVGALLALLEHLLGDSTLVRLAQLGVVIAIAPVIGYAAGKLLGKDL